MEQKPKRLFITNKDVQNLMECHAVTASRYMIKMRRHYKKKAKDAITIYEMCSYFGINLEEVIAYLRLN